MIEPSIRRAALGALAVAVGLALQSCSDGPTAPPLSIVNTSLAAGVVGVPYSEVLTAAGGSGTRRWTVQSGSLPPGLTLLSSGALSGTPTTAGSYPVELSVTSGRRTRTQPFTILIVPALQLTSTSLRAGVEGEPYADTLRASGGAGGYAWSITAGTLPAGVTLAAGGELSGTPTTAGTSNVTVQVTSGVQSASRSIAVVVTPGLSITTTALPDGIVGQPYSITLQTSGGTGSMSWGVLSGALPAGLTLLANGALSGTPTVAGSFTAELSVVSGAQTRTRTFNILVIPALQVTSTTLRAGLEGAAYADTLKAIGGVGGYAWTVSVGTLPAGLTLAANGVLSGTPTAAGSANVTVQVTSGAQSATRSLTVTVAAALAVTTTALAEGIVGQPYLDTLRAIGASGAANWGVLSGSLPAGLTLLSSGALSGTPTTVGTSNFTVQVTSGAQTASRALSVTVVPALAITTLTLPNGTIGIAYAQTLAVIGGTGAYTWSITTGALPTGLTLSAVGTIAGTPSLVANFPFTVRVTSGSQVADRAFTVLISAADAASVEITPPSGSVEQGDSLQLTAVAKDAGGVVIPGRTIVWTTLVGGVASVSNAGKVRGLTLGNAGIVATTSGALGVPVSDTAVISVIPVPVDSVEVVPGAASLLIGETQPFGTVLRGRNGSVLAGRVVNWTSSNPGVAAIDPNTGVVTTGVAGTAVITAISEGKAGTANVTVSRGFILTQVAAGDRHSCGLTDASLVYCWGRNLEGQLGDSTLTDRLFPVRVKGSTPFASVSSGFLHNCALTSTGDAWCWGSNSAGRLGDGTVVSRLTPVPVSGGITFASITAGGTHTCGLTAGGAAYCWGLGLSGQLGDNSVVSKSAPSLVAGGITFASLAAGGNHTCGLTAAGVAYCWGLNSFGQIGDSTSGAGTNRIVPTAVKGGLTFTQISAASAHTCGIAINGQSYCWGSNGSNPATAGRLGDGTTVAQRTAPTLVAGGVQFTRILAGGVHSCARTAAGLIYCWGQNDSGALGDGTFVTRTSPVQVFGGETWDAFAIGNFHTCGIRDLGRTFCWGQNSEGGIGDGTVANRDRPAAVRP